VSGDVTAVAEIGFLLLDNFFENCGVARPRNFGSVRITDYATRRVTTFLHCPQLLHASCQRRRRRLQLLLVTVTRCPFREVTSFVLGLDRGIFDSAARRIGLGTRAITTLLGLLRLVRPAAVTIH
jgi:hypothetical protein